MNKCLTELSQVLANVQGLPPHLS